MATRVSARRRVRSWKFRGLKWEGAIFLGQLWEEDPAGVCDAPVRRGPARRVGNRSLVPVLREVRRDRGSQEVLAVFQVQEDLLCASLFVWFPKADSLTLLVALKCSADVSSLPSPPLRSELKFSRQCQAKDWSSHKKNCRLLIVVLPFEGRPKRPPPSQARTSGPGNLLLWRTAGGRRLRATWEAWGSKHSLCDGFLGSCQTRCCFMVRRRGGKLPLPCPATKTRRHGDGMESD